MASITVLYPSGHDFDLKYYLETHMPLISASWGGDGLKSWEITQFADGQPYQIQAVIKFESLRALDAARARESSAAVRDDVRNFTTAQPVVLKGSHQAFENVA